MAIIKCKMCGGDIELTAEKTFGTCEFCGSTMTLPKIDDDQRAAAFNRGNHFRRIGEFDKALAVYERIVREDDSASYNHTVGLRSDGTVVAVGNNDDRQCDVSRWTNIVSISAGYRHTVGLCSNGTVIAMGENYYDQCDARYWDKIQLPN